MSVRTWPDLPNESNTLPGTESRQEEEARLCRMIMATLERELETWESKDFLERTTLKKDFSKYTDMTLEEMITKSRKLEEAIRRQSSTSEFVEPLRKLAAYQRTFYLYTETGLLINMMVEDLNKKLQECFTISYDEKEEDKEYSEVVRPHRPNISRYI